MKDTTIDLAEETAPATTPDVAPATHRGTHDEPWPLNLLPTWFSRWPDMASWGEFMRAGDGFRVEEFDDEGTRVIRAELPGVDPDKDVEITVDKGCLDISAERTARTEEREKGRYRSEFRYGSFHRRLPLPPGASEADVVATYRDGILEVRVPVATEKAAPARIAVTR